MYKVRETFKDLTSSIENELAKLYEERDGLKKQVELLQQERQPKNYNVERIILDIGGFRYSTSLSTLTSVPGSYFGKLFGGPFPSHLVGEDGSIFLDRDGRLFRFVLNYLREPEAYELRLRVKQDLDDLREEARFYGLEDRMFLKRLFIPEKLDWLDPTTIKVAAFSSEHSDRSFAATNVLDYNRTYWLSLTGQTTNQWLTFDFGHQAYINKLCIKVDYYECTVKDFMVQYTEDEDPKTEDWITIKEFQAECGNRNTNDQFFEGFEFRGRYMRIYCKNNWGPGGGNFILITNIKFYGAVDTDQ